METLVEALRYLEEHQKPGVPTGTAADYLQACTIVIDNRLNLGHVVFVNLPPLSCWQNRDQWEFVLAESTEILPRSLERAILPEVMRESFVASQLPAITVGCGQRLYLHPVGTPITSSYVGLALIDHEGDTLMPSVKFPFSPTYQTLIAGKGGNELLRLSAVADAMADDPTAAIGIGVVVFDRVMLQLGRIIEASVAKGSIVVVLDVAFEGTLSNQRPSQIVDDLAARRQSLR